MKLSYGRISNSVEKNNTVKLINRLHHDRDNQFSNSHKLYAFQWQRKTKLRGGPY